MLSANTLFHFTKKEYLQNILESCSFYPRYCFEDIASKDIAINAEPDLGIPMVCFCDIPLSKINNHINTYGNYGIGLSKEWGYRNGISPLQYMYHNSNTAKTFNEKRLLINSLLEKVNEDDLCSLRDLFLYTNLFLKPYEGRIFRNGKYSTDVIRFYDEKEWRFIPDIMKFSSLSLNAIVDYSNYAKDETIIDKPHEILATHCNLQFHIRDISYLIIEFETEIDELIDKINVLYESKYDSADINRLKTRIISKTRINEDI